MRSPMLARSRGVVQTTASSGAFSPASSMTPMLRGGCGLRLRLGCDFGCVRDLAHHFHDVPVRVEDVQLSIGSVPAAQDLLYALQLVLRPEVARMRAQRLERSEIGRASCRERG